MLHMYAASYTINAFRLPSEFSLISENATEITLTGIQQFVALESMPAMTEFLPETVPTIFVRFATHRVYM